MTDPATLRRHSEAALAGVGARVNPDLPPLDVAAMPLRDGAQVARRALALNVLAGSALGWPRAEGLRWLERHGLAGELQPDELRFLRTTGEMAKADRWLCLHVETLAMGAWLGSLAGDLPPWATMPDTTAALVPNPYEDQSPAPFLRAFRLRPATDVHQALDLYYRAHWHAAQCERDGTANAKIPLASVQFRRLFLEWTARPGVDWHDLVLST
jgi:hypothetical protein